MYCIYTKTHSPNLLFPPMRISLRNSHIYGLFSCSNYITYTLSMKSTNYLLQQGRWHLLYICAGTRGKRICLHMYMNKTYILYLHIARSMLNLCSLRALINVVVAKQNIRTKNSAYNWYKNNVYYIGIYTPHAPFCVIKL